MMNESTERKTLIQKLSDGELSSSFGELSKVGIVFIAFAYLNTYFYYFFFGIDINPFIETSEIIFSLSSLLPISIFSLFYFGLSFIAPQHESSRANRNQAPEHDGKNDQQKLQ